MNQNVTIGLSLILLAGLLGGSLFMPMKRVSGWAWENTWLAYSLCGYFLFPWLLALATVPNLFEVYRSVGRQPVLWTAGLGFGWGVGVVLYGLAVDRVGISLTSGIILGSSVALGSLIPLFWSGASGQTSARAQTWIVVADMVMLVGVLLCAYAGGLREKARAKSAECHGDPVAGPSSGWTVGLLLCLLSGASAPLLNIALSEGEVIKQEALKQDADLLFAPNAVWALAVSMGALPSIFYCLWKLTRQKTWKTFPSAGGVRNGVLCVLMGVFFITSTMFYGSGAARMGTLGPVIGWPIYLSSIILVSNAWGWLLGEWRNVHGRPATAMATGIAVQLLAMILFGIAAS